MASIIRFASVGLDGKDAKITISKNTKTISRNMKNGSLQWLFVSN